MHRTRPPLWISIPVAIVLVVAAALSIVVVLGDETTEADRVEAAFEAYQKAMAERDPQKLCDMTSPATHEAIRDQLSERGRPATCEDFYELAFRESPASALDTISRAEVDSVEVRGNTATVRYYGRSEMKFVKVGDRWLDFHEFGG